MKTHETSIPGVLLIKPEVHGDHRGFFMETWRNEWFPKLGQEYTFVQDNHSKSSRGTLRGLHYQLQQAQGKLVRVIQGEIFDAVVDMRQSSPTFGQWEGVVLSADNRKMLWVPPGFAHGFYVLSDAAEMVYKCTDYYSAEHERSLHWNDPEIGINWPLYDEDILISEKDARGMPFADCEYYT